ncbi:hypothetical protein NPIL_268591 [Nephila pilipes]|uniref:Uncharacterized protein n=1 Tax=Nephila pilipes TaxID=299642 RepID=A0A8X6TI73_NEPPI|nr:hypothetical protein NPIL_268591 [Nephila pilipes]
MDSKYCPNCSAYFEDFIDYNNHVFRCWSNTYIQNTNNSDQIMTPINTEWPESSSQIFDEHHFGSKISAVNTFSQEGVRNLFHISNPPSEGILDINITEGCNQSFEHSNSISSTNHSLNAGDSLQERLFSNLPFSENPSNSAVSDSIFTEKENASSESGQGSMVTLERMSLLNENSNQFQNSILLQNQMLEKNKYSTNEVIPSSSNIFPSFEKSFSSKIFNNFSSNEMFLNRGRMVDNNPINNSFPERENDSNVNFDLNSITTDFNTCERESGYLNKGSSNILSNNNSCAGQSTMHKSFPENQMVNSTFTNAFLPEVESATENESQEKYKRNISVCCRKSVEVHQNIMLSSRTQVTAKTRTSGL